MEESRKYIDMLNKEYIENHLKEQERDLLIAENKIELRDVKGYHGREILELLQNADDAYQKSLNEGNKRSEELEVLIKFEKNILTISNTGTTFDKNGIKAILQGNNSSKKGKYIGNKGTGFRSILNWAEEIKIYSGMYNLEFSKKIASEQFNIIKSKPQIKKQLEVLPNLYLPILAMPRVIEPLNSKFDTTIQVVVDPEKIMDGFGVVEQIRNIDLRLLLFLPNINKITTVIKTSEIDDEIVYIRERSSKEFNENNKKESALRSKNIRLIKLINSTVLVDESFYSFDKVVPDVIEEDEEKKDIRLSIAVPTDIENFVPGHLYSFFPLLETTTPFRCVMHASYVLGDQRDTLNSGEINHEIVRQQLLFLKEVGLQFSRPKYNDLALALLTPIGFEKFTEYKNWKLNSFSKFRLEDFYFQILSDAKILQTVNSKYISIKDCPQIFKKSSPSVFVGKGFNNVLKEFSSELVALGSLELIRKVAKDSKINMTPCEKSLKELINTLTKKWTVEEQVEVFIWWNDVFVESLPNLIKNQEEEWLELNDDCYFLVGNFDTDIPSWVKISALNKTYQDSLLKLTNSNPKIIDLKKIDPESSVPRLIAKNNIYPLINFAYRDKNNIISTVNSSVGDNYNNSIDFVKWLWKSYGNETDEWNPPKINFQSMIKYYFPDMLTKQVFQGENLYFGDSYGFHLATKLFDDRFGEFPHIEELGIQVDLEKFILFISKFGVNKYPKIQTLEVNPIESYKTYFIKEIIQSGTVQNKPDYLKIRFHLPYILNVDKIIQNLSPAEVLEWIKSDKSLRELLKSKHYDNKDAKIYYTGWNQQNNREYKGTVPNYLLHIFNTMQWIKIDEHKYAPIEILDGQKSNNNTKFSEIVAVIDIEVIEKLFSFRHINYEEVIDILELFNFCNDILDLSSENFYQLMLELPKMELTKSSKLSRIVYRIIEKQAIKKIFADSLSKKKFFNEGKLLVKYQGKFEYHLAKESYLPSSKIVSKKRYPIIDKGQRTNNENFIRFFGCKEYSKDYTIDKQHVVVSPSNSKFQDYFETFFKYVVAYNENNANLESNSQKLRITLVSKINIIEKKQAIELNEEYLALRDTITNWYIIIKGDTFDINLISEQIENIFSNIANTPGFDVGKIGELFRARNIEMREFLIKKEFGTLDMIKDGFYSNPIKINFRDTIRKIDPEFNVDGTEIDFDNFFNTENSPKIIKVLKAVGMDLDILTDNGFEYSIDLLPYYKTKLRSILDKTEIQTKFKNYKFNLAFDNKNLQDSFLKEYYDFLNFENLEFKNSIYFGKKLEKELIKKFGNWNLERTSLLDAEEEYTKNYNNLNPENHFSADITNSDVAKIFIYFNREAELLKWFKERKHNEEQESQNNLQSPYDNFKNVVPEQVEIIYHEHIKSEEPLKRNRGGSFNSKNSQRREDALKEYGNKGELLVYNRLKLEVGTDNVYPKSEAFETLEILTPGLGNSGEYDLSFVKDGKEFFVEVKSSSDGKSFFISPGELRFAKDNPKRFLLYLVKINNEHPEKSEVVLLPMEFWNDDKFRRKDIIETIKYEF